MASVVLRRSEVSKRIGNRSTLNIEFVLVWVPWKCERLPSFMIKSIMHPLVLSIMCQNCDWTMLWLGMQAVGGEETTGYHRTSKESFVLWVGCLSNLGR
jgi:hypothetical protein